LNGIKKGKKSELHKWAVALLIYCQVAEIEIEPKYAVYEKINYGVEKVDEIIKDLKLFTNLNNQDPDLLEEYLFSDNQKFNVIDEFDYDGYRIRDWMNKYTRLKEWDQLYLNILKITSLCEIDPNGGENNLKAYLDWSIQEFRLSMPGIVFASVQFAENFKNSKKQSRKNLMKYKAGDLLEERKQALVNMTWDLYLITRFFRDWVDKDDKDEFIFTSGDLAFRTLLRLGITGQNQGHFNHFSEFLSPELADYIAEIEKIADTAPNRICNSDKWTDEYPQILITKYEKELLC